eukprot:5919109-Amphidinium_carterae.1
MDPLSKHHRILPTAFGEASFYLSVFLASASHVRASEACKVSKCALVIAVDTPRLQVTQMSLSNHSHSRCTAKHTSMKAN